MMINTNSRQLWGRWSVSMDTDWWQETQTGEHTWKLITNLKSRWQVCT